MIQVERIQTDILSLSYEEFTGLRKWFANLDWKRWDRQIEKDSNAGKLDFLLEEAKVAKSQNELQAL